MGQNPPTTANNSKKKTTNKIGLKNSGVAGRIIIKLKSNRKQEEKKNFSLQIFDLRGKMVADLSEEAKKGVPQLRWSTSGLPHGSYILRLRLGSASLSRAIVIK